jgi:hypothetical protein
MKRKTITASLFIILCIGLATKPAYGQFFSIVWDPTHTAKTVAQTIMEEMEFAKSYANQIIQIKHAYDSLLELRKRYQLAFEMAKKWADLKSYRAYFTEFRQAGPTHDPYGTQRGLLEAMSGEYDAAKISNSYSASTNDVRAIDTSRLIGSRARTDMASIGLADAAAVQAWANSGSVGGEVQANWQILKNISGDAISDTPEANTEIALLNRMNVATAYQLRSQQDTNTMLVSIANAQAALLKADRDMKARSLLIQDHFNKTARDNWSRMCE